ncbi:MAG TPA: hypothetical protein VNX68_14285, partial [Nitrosopumilaceae archaeon]|nr:hypothetical protein [Nitrosopumilaceae archaeon]
MIKYVYLILLFVLTSFCMSGQSTVITHVNVIPLEAEPLVLSNQTVFITGDRISDIVPFKEAHVKLKAAIIDGTGKYLIPGLADSHVHLPSGSLDELSMQEYFNLCLASGITTMRSMRGEGRHIGLRDSIRKKLFLAPDLYISALLPSDSTVTSEQLKAFIKKSKKEGWDFVKYLHGLTPPLFDSVALYCKQSNIKLAGHVFANDLQTAIKAGQSSVE